MKTKWIPLLAFTLLLAGCNLPGAPMPHPSSEAEKTTAVMVVTVAPVEATATPATVLQAGDLLSGTYDLPVSGERVTLTRGEYQDETVRAALMLPVAWGDLDGDGVDDAAVLIAENTGGSGTFVSLLALLNHSGIAEQAAAKLIDDRPRINGLRIEAGEILLDAVIHDIDDPMAVPTLTVKEGFRYRSGKLNLSSFASKTQDSSVMHSIRMDAPGQDEEAGAVVQVRGSMPVGPFENNLRIRLLDEDENELYAGPFGVQSADIGQPASFDQAVDVSLASAGTRFRIELAELSMKDGSLVAMDSVDLIRRAD